jgi:hypothetical protein
LEVVSSQTSSTGVIMATYRSGAEIKYGSFAAETRAGAPDRPRALSAGPSSRGLLYGHGSMQAGRRWSRH